MLEQSYEIAQAVKSYLQAQDDVVPIEFCKAHVLDQAADSYERKYIAARWPYVCKIIAADPRIREFVADLTTGTHRVWYVNVGILQVAFAIVVCSGTHAILFRLAQAIHQEAIVCFSCGNRRAGASVVHPVAAVTSIRSRWMRTVVVNRQTPICMWCVGSDVMIPVVSRYAENPPVPMTNTHSSVSQLRIVLRKHARSNDSTRVSDICVDRSTSRLLTDDLVLRHQRLLDCKRV